MVISKLWRMKCKILLLFVVLCMGLVSCTNDSELAQMGKNDISTRAVQGIYTYPTVLEVLEQPVVKSHMEAAWARMKSSASKDSRSEFGFYIYKNQRTGKYYVGDMVEGPAITGCEGTNANISLGIVTSNINVCAFFHCHTTLQYCPETTSRYTGESQSDISIANSIKLPGILYDYSSRIIRGGYDKNDSYRVYTFGPDQRPDMPY